MVSEMTHELAVRLRLAISATLLSLWACAWMFNWPLIGNYNLLFLAALALQWPDYQFRRYSKTFTFVYWIILILAVVAIAFVGYALGDSELRAVLHSPYFVLPAWAFGFLSVVINAVPTSAPSGNQGSTAAG